MRDYIWLPNAGYAGTDLPLATVDGVASTPVLYHVHTDHVSRPIMMTNSAKMNVWQATWGPFGQAHSITGAASTNLRFPGQWYQLEAGLHYNWHRHYDPSLGRYTQPDPLGFVDGPNVYGYALNNPQTFVDFDGRRVSPRILGVTPRPSVPSVPRQKPPNPDFKPNPSDPKPSPLPRPGRPPQGRKTIECGPYRIIIETDPFKGKHAHWGPRNNPRSNCLRPDGTPCEDSPLPPNRVVKCLEEDGTFFEPAGGPIAGCE